MLTLFALGLALILFSQAFFSAWRWIADGVVRSFRLNAIGMFFYSNVGKLGLRRWLLNDIPWRGDEKFSTSAADAGC